MGNRLEAKANKSIRFPCFLMMVGILQLISCMNPETNPYPSLQNCTVADSTEGTKDSTDTVVSVKPAEPAQYEVCKDSSNLVRVSIPVIGEHTVQLNESNITRFNGMRRIWIEGPFKAENEIRIYQGDKLVFRTRFQNPI